MFGLSLRAEHYEEILNTHPPIDWLEIISENFFIKGGKPLYYLDQIKERYPICMHGVSLSIGSCDPLDWDYLRQLKKLKDRIQPIRISDHLCWTGVNGLKMPDLLPLPYTEESQKHVVARLLEVQDFLGCSILMENVSSYLSFNHSTMSEWEFLSAVANEAQCQILLDINNIYVSAFNHQIDAEEYLHGIPKNKVLEFHLAGHQNKGDHIIDTHDAPIIAPVWSLYEKAVQHFGHVPVMIERDDQIPSLKELLHELNQAKNIVKKYQEKSSVKMSLEESQN